MNFSIPNFKYTKKSKRKRKAKSEVRSINSVLRRRDSDILEEIFTEKDRERARGQASPITEKLNQQSNICLKGGYDKWIKSQNLLATSPRWNNLKQGNY